MNHLAAVLDAGPEEMSKVLVRMLALLTTDQRNCDPILCALIEIDLFKQFIEKLRQSSRSFGRIQLSYGCCRAAHVSPC